MAKKEALQRHAEDMFIELGYNAKSIADQLSVTEKTVGTWRIKGNWDKRRDELFASPHKLRELFLKEMKHIAGGNEPTMNTDALSKISKVMEGFNNKISPQITQSVIKLLDEFMADQVPDLANKNLEWHKKFILHIINLYG